MTTLKGQNLRILTRGSSGDLVIGMATSCTITLTNNTEDASTKDDVGMASKPTATTKSWQVQVESLNVADVGAMLTAIKNCTKFTLVWDETSTTDNQTREDATFARSGQAYLSDATFTFNDRENSAKSLQFTGVGPIGLAATSTTQPIYSGGAYTKGQFVRLFLSSDNTTTPTEVIAGAKQLSLHTSLTLEENTTKDTSGDYVIQEPTALNYDISTNALVRADDNITSQVMSQTFADIEEIYEAGTPVKWQIANVSGANQRTKGSVIVSGSALLTQLTINAAVKTTATYDAQLTGYGDYTVGS